jgi:hypothetical protein
MNGSDFTVSGVTYVGVILLTDRWWIAFRADDTERKLVVVRADE